MDRAYKLEDDVWEEPKISEVEEFDLRLPISECNGLEAGYKEAEEQAIIDEEVTIQHNKVTRVSHKWVIGASVRPFKQVGDIAIHVKILLPEDIIRTVESAFGFFHVWWSSSALETVGWVDIEIEGDNIGVFVI